MVPFEFQKNVNNFRIDLYLPDQKLAIEIDEHNHADRDPSYEKEREMYIKAQLGCKFLRKNPDLDGFKLSTCIGRIMQEILAASCILAGKDAARSLNLRAIPSIPLPFFLPGPRASPRHPPPPELRRNRSYGMVAVKRPLPDDIE